MCLGNKLCIQGHLPGLGCPFICSTVQKSNPATSDGLQNPEPGKFLTHLASGWDQRPASCKHSRGCAHSFHLLVFALRPGRTWLRQVSIFWCDDTINVHSRGSQLRFWNVRAQKVKEAEETSHGPQKESQPLESPEKMPYLLSQRNGSSACLQMKFLFSSPMWSVSCLRERHHRASYTKREWEDFLGDFLATSHMQNPLSSSKDLTSSSVCNIVPWIHIKCDLNLVRHHGAVPSSLSISKHLWPLVFVKGFVFGSRFWVHCPLWCWRHGSQEEGGGLFTL